MTRPHLSPAQIDALQRELDAVRADVVGSLGADDARYIRKIVHIQRAAGATGRALLAFGLDPLTFAAGAAALGAAKVLENMEIGHNVMHGQWDWMNDPSLSSDTYEWDVTNASDDWRRSHNLRHHTWTNVIDLDHDFGYGVFRMSGEQPWRPFHAVQLPWNAVLAATFQWGIGVQEIRLTSWFDGDLSTRELADRGGPFARKAARQLFKDYVLFPLLTPWNAPRVAAGNLSANFLRNVWTHTIIFCGHFTDDIQTFTRAEVEGESRGRWYLRQILASSNIEGGRLFDVLTGHLSYQIEHHLFPDLPSSRYPTISERVREICQRYDIPYNTGSLARQYGGVLRRLWRHSWPSPQQAA